MKKNSILKNLSKSIALLTVIVIVFGLVSVPVSADAEPTEEVIIENTEAIETEAEVTGETEEVYSAEAVGEPELISADIKKEDDLPDFEAALNGAANDLGMGMAVFSVNSASADFTKPFVNVRDIFKSIEKQRNAHKKTYASASEAEIDCPDELTYKYNKDMDIEVTEKEYEILCRIVQAEAGDQDVYGRILVANVVLNRVNYKKEFKNDIEGVVFEKGQFSPITDGSYDRAKVDDVTKEAVDRCLKGEDYSDGALFFFMRSATSKSAASWFDSLNFIMKYGCHEFFKY